jgi:hypothetical protein
MTRPARPIPPLRVDNNGSYCVVFDATGRLIAQGSKELCDAVAAGQISSITRQGELFNVQT